MAEVKKAIVQIENEIAEGFNRRDIDAVMKHFDESLVGFSSTRHERLRGSQAMRKTFNYYLDQSANLTYQPYEIEVNIDGPVVVATFYWTVTWEQGQRVNEIHGRGSHVFVEKGKEWKIVHEHYSRSQHQPELWDTSPG